MIFSRLKRARSLQAAQRSLHLSQNRKVRPIGWVLLILAYVHEQNLQRKVNRNLHASGESPDAYFRLQKSQSRVRPACAMPVQMCSQRFLSQKPKNRIVDHLRKLTLSSRKKQNRSAKYPKRARTALQLPHQRNLLLSNPLLLRKVTRSLGKATELRLECVTDGHLVINAKPGFRSR